MRRQLRMTPRIPLTPVERHRRSRETLVGRVMSLVVEGHSLAAIARREHMPRRETVQRWLTRDSAVHARYEAARRLQAHVMADEAIALADRFAATQRGRRRTAAVKLQIEARKWRLKMFADGGRNDRRPGTKQRGLSDEDIAVLEAAARQQTQRDIGAVAETEATEGTSEWMENSAATRTGVFEPDGSESPHNRDEETETPSDTPDDIPDDSFSNTAAGEPPNIFVPKWFDDDLRKPERPYDPLKW